VNPVTVTLSWRRVLLALYVLGSIVTLLYTVGAPHIDG